MKKLLFSALLALGMLTLSGCYESAQATDASIKTTKAAGAACDKPDCKAKGMKCGSGKCGKDMKKPAMKCGAGKCGKEMKKPEMKCGSGKCGSK
jgi:uncharacterized low-complexity protein